VVRCREHIEHSPKIALKHSTLQRIANQLRALPAKEFVEGFIALCEWFILEHKARVISNEWIQHVWANPARHRFVAFLVDVTGNLPMIKDGEEPVPYMTWVRIINRCRR